MTSVFTIWFRDHHLQQAPPPCGSAPNICTYNRSEEHDAFGLSVLSLSQNAGEVLPELETEALGHVWVQQSHPVSSLTTCKHASKNKYICSLSVAITLCSRFELFNDGDFSLQLRIKTPIRLSLTRLAFTVICTIIFFLI